VALAFAHQTENALFFFSRKPSSPLLEALTSASAMSSTVAPCCASSNPGRPHVRASAARCAQVRSYKYTSPDDTLLESLILNRFWAFAVRAFVPEWVAPNLLTFVGFLHALAAYALLLAHSPALDGSAPPWVYVACAACLFVYQTMDGMDGKQARRVGAGSPLGEVVDHGADAIASCVYGVFLVDVFGIGWEFAYAPSLGRWPAVCLITYSRAAFALDSVAAAFTGRLPVARLDAQELQAVIQLTCLWNAAHGVGFWHRLVAFGALGVNDPVPLGAMVVLLGAGAGVYARVKSAAATLRFRKSPHLPAYARGPALIYARVLSFELVLTAAIAHCAHFPLCHVVTTVAFGDCMVRLMHLRVADPEFGPLSSAYCSAYVALAACVPAAAGAGDGAGAGSRAWTEEGLAATCAALVLAAMWEYAALFSTLVAQLTGCLGLPANPFVLAEKSGRRQKGA
jgi:ethanolaminephosphotransferase